MAEESITPGRPMGATILQQQSNLQANCGMFSVEGTVRCVVVDVDMVGYSDVARMLEENTSAGTVGELNRQIRTFITSALDGLTSPGAWRVLGFTGDGGIVLFERAEDAHLFSYLLQGAAKRYSEERKVPSAKRRFRIGIATGEVHLSRQNEHGDQYAGIAIANAVRLQTAAAASEILIDSQTYRELSATSQQQYSGQEEVRGKRDEVFHARRCAIGLETESIGEAPAWWKRHRRLLIATAMIAVAGLVFGSRLTRNNGRIKTADVIRPVEANAVNTGAGPVVTLGQTASVQGGSVLTRPAAPEIPNKQKKNIQLNHKTGPATAGDTAQAASLGMTALPQASPDTQPPLPSEFDSENLIGTWEIASGDPRAAEVTLLELRRDGTYKKTLSANVKNFDGTSNTYGTTHQGRWRSRDMIVYLSGDGNSPAYLQDLRKGRKLN